MGTFYAEDVPSPIMVRLNPKRGSRMRDVFLLDVPLFSDDFLSVLQAEGVDNLQLFDAEIHAPDGTVYTNYKAVNIIGLVLCANLRKSIYLTESEPPLMEFSKLVIDESKIVGANLFRLAEDSLVVIVSESLKDKIEQANLTGFSLKLLES